MIEPNTFKTAGLSGDYDLVFPLGASELCSFALRLYGLQREPFFFDDMLGMTLRERAGMLAGSADGARGLGDGAMHRFRRLISRIETSGSALAVYAVAPGENAPSDAELKLALSELRGRFAGTAFELLLVTSRRGCVECEWRGISEGLAAVTVDYHMRGTDRSEFSFGYDHHVLASVFTGMRMRGGTAAKELCKMEAESWGKSEFRVWHRKGNCKLFKDVRLLRFTRRRRDRSDIPLHAREERLCSWRIGRTAWAVVRQKGPMEFSQLPRPSERNAFVHARLVLMRFIHVPLLFLCGLLAKRRKFSHFLLLGYNCELAYRFIMANGFLDSTFFAWIAAWRFGNILDALKRFDGLFTGELVFSGGGDLLMDVPTGVSMHARTGMGQGEPSAGESHVESAKTELRSRAAYLREKFYRQLRDDEPTLAVVKMGSCDCPRGDENAQSLIRQLKSMGGRNFRLLVVCQKADAGFFPKEHPDYDLRTVARFNPDWMVASEHVGDRFSWMRIWREFSPVRKMVQKKTYKFQERRAP